MDIRNYPPTTSYEYYTLPNFRDLGKSLIRLNVKRIDRNPSHITPTMLFTRGFVEFNRNSLCWRTLKIGEDTWRMIGYDRHVDVFIFREVVK